MKLRTLALALFPLALAACSNAGTRDVGSYVDQTLIRNAPGQTAFSANYDPANPGIPKNIQMVQGKDDESVLFQVTYAYPDGTKIDWAYSVGKSIGSTQAQAQIAAQQVIAGIQAETGQKLGADAIAAIGPIISAALGLPPLPK